MSTSAVDAAAAVLTREPNRDQMQLHKLLYLVQAASLAWYSEPAFGERIEAWKYGPMVRRIAGHYMQYDRDPIPSPMSGDPGAVTERTSKAIDWVLEKYGHLSGPELAELTKYEGSPWRQVRGDLPPDAVSEEEIPQDLMREHHHHYGVAPTEPTKRAVQLAERFFRGGDDDALADLLEDATGVRPTIS